MDVFSNLGQYAVRRAQFAPEAPKKLLRQRKHFTLALLAYIKDHPGCTAWSIQQALGFESQKTLDHLCQLVGKGELRTERKMPKPGTAFERTNRPLLHYWSIE